MEASRVTKSLISFIFVENHYLEKTGEKECQSGSKVLLKSKCESACKELEIETDTAVRADDRTCFSTLDQKCRMQKNLPSSGGFRLICKLPGN